MPAIRCVWWQQRRVEFNYVEVFLFFFFLSVVIAIRITLVREDDGHFQIAM